MSQPQMKGPGLLYVPSEPGPKVSEEEFHDWYNDYHGPLRARLPFVKDPRRYKANDGEKPTWLASYDIDDLALFEERPYARMADERNAREKDVISKMELLDRRIYSFVSSRGEAPARPEMLLAVTMTMDPKDVEEFDRWYDEEHTDLLSKVKGWHRTRRFMLVDGKGPKAPQVECLALHDYDADNGLGGPDHQRAIETPWRNRIVKMVTGRVRRTYSFYHEFPPLPEPAQKFIGPNVLEGTVITNDGFPLQYRIDGPQDPNSPAIVLINSVLTTHHIWDRFLELVSSSFPKHRFIRYNPRGYAALLSGTKPISIDVLADDVEYLLYRLSIPKATLVGVSMGGMTTLTFALRHPKMLENFVACDFNVSGGEAYRKAWDERIELVKTKGGMDTLADQTVNRWFGSAFVQAGSPISKDVRAMIQNADVQGFIDNARAICEFDIAARLGEIEVAGTTLVGEQDGGGALPPAMEAFTKDISNCKLVKIPNAGHLPMVDQPEIFAEVVKGLLG
jgi:pimeloyl-ACP methyl ester carboxylesterase